MIAISLILLMGITYFITESRLGLHQKSRVADLLMVGKICIYIGFSVFLTSIPNHLLKENMGILFPLILLAIGCGVMLRANLFLKSFSVSWNDGNSDMPEINSSKLYQHTQYISQDRHLLMQADHSTVRELAKKLELTSDQEKVLYDHFYKPWL